MAYHPASLQNQDNIGVVETISSSMATSAKKGFVGKTMTNLRNPCSGETQGENNLPVDVAPLIFPENLESTRRSIEKDDGYKKTLKCVADFFDRRARAKYVCSSPFPFMFFTSISHNFSIRVLLLMPCVFEKNKGYGERREHLVHSPKGAIP